MIVSQEQLNAVIALPGPKRYDHFIKQVADWEEVWTLYQDGWALASTSEGDKVFPLWPAKAYAEICAQREWHGYEAVSLPLEKFMQELLPKLKADGVLPGIFYTPSDKGITPDVAQLLSDLSAELENY